jgi:dihydroorotase
MPTTTTLIIRDARVFLPDGEWLMGDVLVENGTIAAIAESLPVGSYDREIAAAGLTLLPGVIDPQVHFREPGLEHKEDLATASRACVKGGVTSFLEMPNTKPLTTTQGTLNDKLALAASKSLANYGFFIGATPANLPDLNTANPTPGIKIFMGSAHGDLLVSEAETIEKIFASGTRLIAVHAEDQDRIVERRELFRDRWQEPRIHSTIQDDIAALEATKLAIDLSEKYQRRLHILHLSTGIEAEYLRERKPAWVTAEVTPQHLLLNLEDYDRIGTLAQMNPPLRTQEDNDILWSALLDGTIDFIATDHAPHTLEEKSQAYPNSPSGMPGVETSLPLMLTQAMAGKCSIAQVINWMSTAVAKGYGIVNKGQITVGFDADLTLVDLANYRQLTRSELATKCGWSPFEGWHLTGFPVYTIVGGSVAFDRGKFDDTVRGKALTFAAD